MEMKLIIRNGIKVTEFRVSIKNFNLYKDLLSKYVDVKNPIKKNSRFIYFEYEGDLLN